VNVAIINALRTLQDRVGKLELEKQNAKERIRTLEEELMSTRQLLSHEKERSSKFLIKFIWTNY
jgi:prefoldin subunit 5